MSYRSAIPRNRQHVTFSLRCAELHLKAGEKAYALASLNDALDTARHYLPGSVPANRALRAYIVTAIEALK